jgi:hypothetical protein
VVNRVSGDSIRNGGFRGTLVTVTPEPSVLRCYVTLLHCYRNQNTKKHAGLYLNNGRGYVLTGCGQQITMQAHKAAMHVKLISKNKVKNRVQTSTRCATNRKASGADFTPPLKQHVEVCTFFHALFSAQRKVSLMHTSLNPSCVCSTLHETPVEQLFQQSTDWENTQPVKQSAERAEGWPIYYVDVPREWEPGSTSAIPPNAKRFNNFKIASEVAAMLNRDILKKRNGGSVWSWYIRIKKRSDRQGIICVNVPGYQKWKPASAYELPPTKFVLMGTESEAAKGLDLINSRLSASQGRPQRAFIMYSIGCETHKE